MFLCSRETYNALANWLTDARTLASPNIVIVLVGNKKDLEAEREVTFMEASRFAQENGWFVIIIVNSILLSRHQYFVFFDCRAFISGDECTDWGKRGGSISKVHENHFDED